MNKGALILISALLATGSVQAVDYTFLPVTGEWDLPANWSPGGATPTTIPSGDAYQVPVGRTATISVVVNSEGSIEVLGTLEVDYFLYNDGTLTNENMLLNHHSIQNNGGLDNQGALLNDFVLDNYGTLTNQGYLENQNQLSNYGTLINPGDLDNFYLMGNQSLLQNSGTLTNHYSLDNQSTLENSGTLDNDYELINSGTIDSSILVQNDGTLTNSGTIEGTGTFENNYILTSTGELLVQGTWNNGYDLDNDGDMTIEAGGELVNTGSFTGKDFTLSGRFENLGSFIHEGGTLTGIGLFAQIHLSSPAAFYHVTVEPGALLWESVANDNATVDGTLTNLGTIRKTKPVVSSGAVSFGLTDVSMDIGSLGGLSNMQVDRVGQNHPDAWGPLLTGEYWSIQPTGTGYDLALTLPHQVVPHANAFVARHQGGTSWSLGRSSSNASTVTLTGVTQLSDWTVSNGPLTPPQVPTTGPIGVGSLLLLVSLALVRRSRD